MTSTNKANQPAGSTALFVDYDDLHRNLARLTRNESASVKVVAEMIDTLRNNVAVEQSPLAETRAYGDFASLRAGDQAKNMLYMKGIETRYAPSANRESTIELQIGVDAMELLHKRPDVTRLVLLSGQRLYLPLVQAFRKYGRSILVAGLADPASPEHGFSGGDDWFMSARELLTASAQEFLNAPVSASPVRSAAPPAQRRARIAPPPPVERKPRPTPPPAMGPVEELDDPILVRTLEIIDDHFGQYDEVYLTPLLRKLSDLVDERRYDPKNLISDLEARQAVRLEKRSGFPHDYTVLILDERHPTVARILSGNQRSESQTDAFASSSPWDYDEDAPDDAEDNGRIENDQDGDSGDDYDDTFGFDEYDEYDRDLGASA